MILNELTNPRGHDVKVEVDAQRIQQVTLNLLSNALKFTRPGGTIEVGSDIIVKKRTKFIQVYVKDNGMGIAKEDQSKLFRLFGKLKQNDKAINSKGIGLGLNICKQICQVFEGDIDVNSEVGLGSKFYFWFRIENQTHEIDESSE